MRLLCLNVLTDLMRALSKPIPKEEADWPKGFILSDIPKPTVADPNDVILKVITAGVCGTDVSIYQSNLAMQQQMAKVKKPHIIIGHEFCGVFDEAGAAAISHLADLVLQRPFNNERITNFLKDKTAQDIKTDPDFIDLLRKEFYITAEMHVTCGKCLQCTIGQKHICQKTEGQGMHRDGTYAEYVKVPAENLVIFSKEEIPSDIIAFMDAIGNGVHLTQTTDIVGRSVLIIGTGVQGAVAVALAKSLGSTPIFCTDTSQMKLDIAKRLGADFCFDMSTPNASERLHETIIANTEGNGVDAVFEVSGKYQAYQSMFANVRLGGSLTLLGLPSGNYPVDFSPSIIFRGLTIKGVYGRRVFDSWHIMQELLSQGLGKTLLDNGIITHRLPLERYEEGFNDLIAGKAVKVLLYPHGIPA